MHAHVALTGDCERDVRWMLGLCSKISWLIGAAPRESADVYESSSDSSNDEEEQPRSRKVAPRRIATHKLAKQAGCSIHKPARDAADKILLATTDVEARRRMVELVGKQVLGKAESTKTRVGLAVLERVKDFREQTTRDVVPSPDRDAALLATQMATLPLPGEHLSSAYARETGFDKKYFKDIHHRRERPAEYHMQPKGLYRRSHKQRGKLIPLEEKAYAVEVWRTEAQPRAQGSGEYNKVTGSFLPYCDGHSMAQRG